MENRQRNCELITDLNLKRCQEEVVSKIDNLNNYYVKLFINKYTNTLRYQLLSLVILLSRKGRVITK